MISLNHNLYLEFDYGLRACFCSLIITYLLLDHNFNKKRFKCKPLFGRRDVVSIKKLIPKPKGRYGKDNRLFMEAICWMLRTGAAWRDLIKRFRRIATQYDKTARMYLTGVMFVSILLALK